MEDRSLDDFLDNDSGAAAEEEPGDEDSDIDGPDGGDSVDTPAKSAADSESATSVDADQTDNGADDVEGGGADDRADGAVDQADDTEGPRVDPASVEPAAATYTWSGDGGDCDACGEVVDRRWRQDDRLVCPDCKDW